MAKIDIDDEMFYKGSLDVLLEAVAQDEAEEHKQPATDTEDDFVKVEKYQRQTEKERQPSPNFAGKVKGLIPWGKI